MEKYFEDVRQEEKHVQDLLESIMKPPDPLKSALRRTTIKMSQFTKLDPKPPKSGFALLRCLEDWRIPTGGQDSLRA